VIRSIEKGLYEYGAIKFTEPDSSESPANTERRRLQDTIGLVKVLQDMLFMLHDRVGHNEVTIRKMQVVGFMCAGRKIEMMRMGCWKGSVAVLVKVSPMNVPLRDERALDLLKIIVYVHRMKVC
jgi:hypothetical protein